MATVSITIEGDPSEVREALQILMGASHLANVSPQSDALTTFGDAGDDEGTSTPKGTPWTMEEFRLYWHSLRPDAREIYKELAKAPDAFFWQLQEATSMDGSQVAGRLSSGGHVLRRFPGKPAPLTRDYQLRQYHMRPEIADFVRQIAEESDNASDA